jgi:hypothetical protein
MQKERKKGDEVCLVRSGLFVDVHSFQRPARVKRQKGPAN